MQSFIDNINKRIKEIRKTMLLTQEAFARPLGITQGHVTDLERGKKRPSDTLLIAIIYRYAVNPKWLYDGVGEMFIGHGEVSEVFSPYGPEGEIKEVVKRIAFIYDHGTEDQKASLYGHVSRIYDGIQKWGASGTNRDRAGAGTNDNSLSDISDIEKRQAERRTEMEQQKKKQRSA